MALFIWNVPTVVCIGATTGTGRLALRLPAIPVVIDVSDIIHSFDHDKSISILQLINGKSRDLYKLLKYFNGTTTSASNALLFGGCFLFILSYIQKIYWLLFYCYLSYH